MIFRPCFFYFFFHTRGGGWVLKSMENSILFLKPSLSVNILKSSKLEPNRTISDNRDESCKSDEEFSQNLYLEFIGQKIQYSCFLFEISFLEIDYFD